MPFDDSFLARLTKEYDVVTYTVSTSTKISTRASNVTSGLSEPSPKSRIVALHAGIKASSKIISIVEIAKRDLVAKGSKVFQYTALSSDLVEIDRVPKGKGDGEGGEVDESQGAFETMGVSGLNEKKKREMPNLTVYLSLQSVKELRNEYGEQKT